MAVLPGSHVEGFFKFTTEISGAFKSCVLGNKGDCILGCPQQSGSTFQPVPDQVINRGNMQIFLKQVENAAFTDRYSCCDFI